MSEKRCIFVENEKEMKTKAYSTQFVSVRGKLQVRFLNGNKEYRSRMTSTPCSPEELANPNALLDATLSALTAKIKTALWQAELTGSDPYVIVFPNTEAQSLLPPPLKYFEQMSKRDVKLKNFAAYIDKNLDWDDITDSMLEEYKDHLRDADFAENTMRAYLAGVRVALNKARRDGIDFPAKEYQSMLSGNVGTSVGVYLVKSEVELFQKVETLNDLEEAVKTMALIGFFVGARFSDFSQLKSYNIQSVEYDNADGTREVVKHIQYVSEKTSTISQVPLKPCVIDLLSKDIITPTIQQMNTILPRLAERAGINTEVSVVHGDKTHTGPRYKFFKSHSCRRTFAVNVYVSGEYDIRDIALFLGHKSTTTTLSYISCPAVKRTGKIVSWFL